MTQRTAGYSLPCFAQSGNCYKPALMLQLADAERREILRWPRIRGEPRWMHPYELMPGHPRPQAA